MSIYFINTGDVLVDMRQFNRVDYHPHTIVIPATGTIDVIGVRDDDDDDDDDDDYDAPTPPFVKTMLSGFDDLAPRSTPFTTMMTWGHAAPFAVEDEMTTEWFDTSMKPFTKIPVEGTGEFTAEDSPFRKETMRMTVDTGQVYPELDPTSRELWPIEIAYNAEDEYLPRLTAAEYNEAQGRAVKQGTDVLAELTTERLSKRERERIDWIQGCTDTENRLYEKDPHGWRYVTHAGWVPCDMRWSREMENRQDAKRHPTS